MGSTFPKLRVFHRYQQSFWENHVSGYLQAIIFLCLLTLVYVHLGITTGLIWYHTTWQLIYFMASVPERGKKPLKLKPSLSIIGSFSYDRFDYLEHITFKPLSKEERPWRCEEQEVKITKQPSSELPVYHGHEQGSFLSVAFSILRKHEQTRNGSQKLLPRFLWRLKQKDHFSSKMSNQPEQYSQSQSETV